ncbi:MAG: VOC family protein [Mesorhizobium sp.]
MSAPDQTSGPYVAEPFVFVTDMDRAIEFYRSRLGFELSVSYGEPPHFAQVTLNGARLNLRHVDNVVIDPTLRTSAILLSAAITVDDAQALFASFTASGTPFFQELRREPWGATTFIVSDPDANLILFAS